MLWDLDGGTGLLGMLRDQWGTGPQHPTHPHGEVDDDPHHGHMQLASSAPHIHGATILLPFSLLSFQQVFILFLGIMS